MTAVKWLEVHIDTNHTGLEPVETMLSALGIDGVVIDDETEFEDFLENNGQYWDYVDEDLRQEMQGRSRITFYLEAGDEGFAKLGEVRIALEELKKTRDDCGTLLMTLDDLEDADWENNWKQYFHPIKIGERLLIRPTWEDEYDAEGRAVLHLEPGLAFGTGSHETTRLCLEALEKNIKGGEKVLDVGCGSGILAIASLLLGADSATGVDIDELAVKTAEENGKMNGFGNDRLTFIHGDLADKVSGKFDIVVANIVADVIIMFCKTVPDFMADNAVFITSGIIDIREQEVVDAFAENGFEIIARHADGGWRCFECRRKK